MENKSKRALIDFKVKIEPKEKLNENFTLCRCTAFGLGKNRNFSHVSRETMDCCMSSLDFAPVVGHIIEEYDEEGNLVGKHMGGHDYGIMFKDGDFKLKPLTVPYGCVIDGTAHYETVPEYMDNKDREYVVCDIVLWTGRYPELLETIYDEETWFNESAELNVKEYRQLEEDSNYWDITDFTFDALCLLGKSDDSEWNVEPCFIESKIQPKQFTLNDEFTTAMNEMKKQLEFCFQNQHSSDATTTEEFDIEKTNNNGGKSTMSEEVKDTEVVEEVAETEVVEENVEETLAEKAVVEETPQTETLEANTPSEDHSVEESVKENAADETTETEKNSDDTSDDFSAKYAELKTSYATLEKEFSEYKAEHSFLNSEIDSVKKEAINEFKVRNDAENKVFASYIDRIGETEEFASLKESASDYSIEALEKECIYIVGKYAMTTEQKNEPKQAEPLKFSLENKEPVEEKPYGGVVEKYSKKKNGGN